MLYSLPLIIRGESKSYPNYSRNAVLTQVRAGAVAGLHTRMRPKKFTTIKREFFPIDKRMVPDSEELLLLSVRVRPVPL